MLGVCNVNIPSDVDDGEVVLRTIFHPANFKSNKKTLASNFMTPPACPDEDDPSIMSNKLSVTKYVYAGLNFCKAHGRLHSNPDCRRSYYGFAMFVVEGIRKFMVDENNPSHADVVSSPTEDNPAHANVVLPFNIKFEKGKPKPSEFSSYCKKLADSAKILREEDEEGGILSDRELLDYPLKGCCILKDKSE